MFGRRVSFLSVVAVALTWVTSAAAQQAPAPARISNAASLVPIVAPGVIASIFGTNLAEATVTAPTLPLPYELAGTSVLIGRKPAQLYYVSPTQINLVVPPDIGDGQVVVVRNGTTSAALSAEMEFFHEGFFTQDGSGEGPAVAFHADGTLVNADAPAQRGETVKMLGTGKGVRNPSLRAPEPAPIVRVASSLADVQFWGAAADSPGMDRLDITIPTDVPTGPAIPVTIQLLDRVSKTVTLAIQ